MALIVDRRKIWSSDILCDSSSQTVDTSTSLFWLFLYETLKQYILSLHSEHPYILSSIHYILFSLQCVNTIHHRKDVNVALIIFIILIFKLNCKFKYEH
jgi:hypothetical protein